MRINLGELACRIGKLPDVSKCEPSGNESLDIWVQTVSEVGKIKQVSILGSTVYLKDAPVLLFSKLGYMAQNGDNINLAGNWLSANGWEEWEDKKRSEWAYNSEAGQLYRFGKELGKRYLSGERRLLSEMLANLDRLWNSYYQTYPPQLNNARPLAQFLATNPHIAEEYVRWYSERGYGHGAPHCFCWQVGTSHWFWANAGGERYKPKPWMEDIRADLRPQTLLLRFRSSVHVAVPPVQDGHWELAEALVARDVSEVQRLISGRFRASLFSQPDIATENHPEGLLLGKHYTAWVPIVTRLRQLKRDDAAEILLLALLPVIEKAEAGTVVPPWYYNQLCVIYRKSKQFDKEAQIIERANQFSLPRKIKGSQSRVKTKQPSG